MSNINYKEILNGICKHYTMEKYMFLDGNTYTLGLFKDGSILRVDGIKTKVEDRQLASCSADSVDECYKTMFDLILGNKLYAFDTTPSTDGYILIPDTIEELNMQMVISGTVNFEDIEGTEKN